MARQTDKFSDRFGSGGNKDGSSEEKFFLNTDSNLDPEWKVIDLLRDQVDTLTDVINANDAGSGSFAGDIKALTIASGSFSTRVTANDAKVVITPLQAKAITANSTISNKTQGTLVLSLSGNNLIITSVVGRTTRVYAIEPQ